MKRSELPVKHEAQILHYNKMAWAILSYLDKQRSHSYSENLPIFLCSFRRLTMARSLHEVTEEEFIHLVSIFRKMETDFPQVLRLNSSIQYDGDMRTTTIGTHYISAFPLEYDIQDTIMRYVTMEFAK